MVCPINNAYNAKLKTALTKAEYKAAKVKYSANFLTFNTNIRLFISTKIDKEGENEFNQRKSLL